MSATVSPTAPRTLASLTGLRFLAAAAVVLFHVTGDLHGLPVIEPVAKFGYLGVTFFFVLSGFVLAWAHRAGDPTGAFLRRRFARIYPLYLVAMVPILILAAAGEFDLSGAGSVANLFAVQSWVPTDATIGHSPNRVGWSIACEAFFYAVFPWLIARMSSLPNERIIGRIGAAYALMIVIAGMALAGGSSGDVDLFLYHFPLYNLGFFVIGMGTALLVQRGAWPAVRLSRATVALAVLLVLLALHGGDIAVTVVELLALPLIVVLIGSAATTDLARGPSPLRAAWLVELGVWSYALYLVHWPIAETILALDPRGLGASLVSEYGLALTFLVGSVALAFVAHRFVERPLERQLRGAPPRANDDA